MSVLDRIDIEFSVGWGGTNTFIDILRMQRLLNAVKAIDGGPRNRLEESGVIESPLYYAIRRFQKENLDKGDVDGLVRPNGDTLELLNEYAACRIFFEDPLEVTHTILQCPHGGA